MGTAQTLEEFAGFAGNTTNTILLATTPTSTPEQRDKALDELYNDPVAPIFLALMVRGGMDSAKKWSEKTPEEKKAIISKVDPRQLKKAQEWAKNKAKPQYLDQKLSDEHRGQVIDQEIADDQSVLRGSDVKPAVRSGLDEKIKTINEEKAL